MNTVVANKNTRQSPMSVLGLTGNQVIKFIPADRVYCKAPDSQDSAPGYFTISNGQTPPGWTDLGTLTEESVKMIYQPQVKTVETGPNKYVRGAYYSSQGASAQFSLAQFDDVALTAVTGLTPTVVAGGFSWSIGSTDMIQLAVLFVEQDILTGKEVQFYNPCAYISFSFDLTSDARTLGITAILPFFTPAGTTVETLFTTTIFSLVSTPFVTPVVTTSYTMSLLNTTSTIVSFGLGTTDVVPFVTDTSGNPIEYGDFQVINSGNATLTFTVPQSGSVVVKSFPFPTGYATNFTATSSGSEYLASITHGLGTTNVGVCVYVAGLVVQTGTVTVVDSNHITVQFSTPVSGRAIIYAL